MNLLVFGGSSLFAGTRINVTRWRWHALILSLVIVGAGLITVVTKGVSLGIDVSGGTLAVVQFGCRSHHRAATIASSLAILLAGVRR